MNHPDILGKAVIHWVNPTRLVNEPDNYACPGPYIKVPPKISPFAGGISKKNLVKKPYNEESMY